MSQLIPKLISIILFLFPPFFLYAEQKIINYNYANYKVSWIEKENSEERRLTFKNKESKTIKEFFFEIDKFLNFGEYKTGNKSYLYVLTHSGGESGGSLDIRFFNQLPNSKEFYQLEMSGYGNFEIIDLKFDKNEEIKIPNEKFYGLKLDSKENGECSITPSLYLSGYAENNYPEYFVLLENKYGKLVRKNITYSANLKKYILPYINKTEKKLNEDKNKVYDSQTYFQDIFQYFSYMKNTGKKNIAISKIKNSNIQVKMDCTKSKEPIYAYLIDLVIKSFEKK